MKLSSIINYCFLIVFSTALLACQSTKEQINTKLSSIDSLSKQKFTIDGEKDNVIKGKQGASILFPAGTLCDEKGIPVKGKIEVELVEVNTIKDFIKSGITTESDGKLLISDGSYFINAKKNGKNLSITDGKNIYGRFPAAVKDKDMKFFNGNLTKDGNVNWQLDEMKKMLSEKIPLTMLPKSAEIKKDRAASAGMTISPAKQTELIMEYNDLSEYLHDNIYNDETKYVKYGAWYIPEKEAERLTQSKDGRSTSDYQPFNNYKNEKKNENQESIWESESAPATPFRYKASIVEEREKRFKEISKQLGIDAPQKPDFKNQNKVKVEQQTNESWDAFIRRGDEEYKKQFGTAAYLFAINKLGWVNCDKFSNDLMVNYEGTIVNNEGAPFDYEIEVHLISRKEKIHLKNITSSGKYNFKYPFNKEFDVVFVSENQEVSKSFDGSSITLDEIRLENKN